MPELRGEALAHATLDYIREHPKEWKQYCYYNLCGTTACYAGHALILGGKIRNIAEGSLFSEDSSENARELLGWTRAQASHVFLSFTEDFSELEERVKEVLNGDVE
jgi:hypothetical protein